MNETLFPLYELVTHSMIAPNDNSFSTQFDISSKENIRNFSVTEDIIFESELDGDPIAVKYDNLIINEGCTLTVSQRCKGLYLSVFGNLIVNGTISMTGRGANTEGKYILIDKNGIVYFYDEEYDKSLYDDNWEHISAVGGIGVGTKAFSVTNGANGINGACGSGGNSYNKGGNGTSFSGGAGAAGMASAYRYTNNAPVPTAYGKAGNENGGAGGDSVSAYYNYGGANYKACGGTGAGNPAGNLSSIYTYQIGPSTKGENGTGGLLIIFVKGDLIIGNNGSIQANGCNGGNGMQWISPPTEYSTGTGGCGSGGGAIHVFYSGSITNTDKIVANGGIGGSGYRGMSATFKGSNGGNGTVNIQKYKSNIL